MNSDLDPEHAMRSVDQNQTREQDAAAWIARLQSRSISTHDLADFAHWRRDPENAAAYERAEEFWETSHSLKHDPDIESAVSSALNSRRLVGRVRAPFRIAALVAGAVALLAMTIFLGRPYATPKSASYATITGQRSTLSLNDGTRVQLDTDSKITAEISASRREIDLSQGRVYFDVEHDPKRPFVVTVDDELTVTAHGTKFDVFRHDGVVDVILYQGSVVVADRATGESVTLASGQMTRMVGRDLVPPAPARMSEASLWRSGRLSFNDTPLDQALAELNRYTTRPLRLSRASLAKDRISGEFSADDIDGFAAATNALYGAGAVVRSEPAG